MSAVHRAGLTGGDSAVHGAQVPAGGFYMIDELDELEANTCEARDYRCCETDASPADERGTDEWYVRHVAAWKARQ